MDVFIVRVQLDISREINLMIMIPGRASDEAGYIFREPYSPLFDLQHIYFRFSERIINPVIRSYQGVIRYDRAGTLGISLFDMDRFVLSFMAEIQHFFVNIIEFFRSGFCR